MTDHQHTWRTIWELTMDGMRMGWGARCVDCDEERWTGTRPDWAKEKIND